MDDRPAFFKVFIPEMCSLRMQIPPAFTPYLRGQRLPKRIYLRDRQGNVWPVEMTKEGRDIFFDKGWIRFVEDNCIEVGEFLVFELSGDHFFEFKHLGRSGCEKEKASSSSFTVKPENVEEEEEEDDADAENEEREEEDTTDDEDDESEEGGDADDEEEEEDEMELADLVENDEEYEMKEQASTHGSKKRSITRLCRADIIRIEDEVFGSGLIQRPKNPYFVIKIRDEEKRQELFIPIDVVRDHDLTLPSKIDIVDEQGKRWPSEITIWKCGRIVLKKGWSAFRRRNPVKINDKCLFEFVSDEKKKEQLCLRVRLCPA